MVSMQVADKDVRDFGMGNTKAHHLKLRTLSAINKKKMIVVNIQKL
jgi:hypothetical protein